MRQPHGPLSDRDAHEAAMSLPMSSVVQELVRLLGATTVALIGGVTETRAVQQWMTGREPQRSHVLRFTLQIASMIAAEGKDQSTVRAWFQGCNPHLHDAIPALMLRNEPLEAVQARLMGAARQFAAR